MNKCVTANIQQCGIVRRMSYDRDKTSKICKKCEIRKDISEFHKMRNGHKTKCKDCCSEIARNYNRDRVVTLNEQRTMAIREPNRLFISLYLKQRSCVDCGEDNWLVLEFDHIKGDKYRNVSELMNSHSVEKVVEEVLKCEVVCGNCHKLRTMNRIGSWRLQYVE